MEEYDIKDITALEEAVINVYDFAAGLASMALVYDMIQRSEECSIAVKDRELPHELRVQALKDSRHCNQTLNLVATARAVMGISA